MRLADFIEQNLPAILAEWDRFAATLLPAAQHSSAVSLRDHAEEILRVVATDLRTGQSEAAREAKSKGSGPRLLPEELTAAETHAVLRATGGFSLQQLVAEYRALRASVLRLWFKAVAPGHDTLEDMVRFNEAIDQAVAESVDHHAREVERWRHVFLGVLGHDLRGPLNAILLTADLIAHLTKDTNADAPTLRLIRSGERMKELLDDLLDLNRAGLELGIPIQPVRCELRTVCEQEVELQRASLPHADIDFSANGAGAGLWDPSRIKQMLANLVSNAARHGSRGGRIRVELRDLQQGVRLSVENEGSTLPQESLEALFEPLKRGSAGDEARDPTHLGLGLFIVKQIALAHRGTVAAESTEGRTLFVVEMPKAA
jgi:signal transduction histidine kinase